MKSYVAVIAIALILALTRNVQLSEPAQHDGFNAPVTLTIAQAVLPIAPSQDAPANKQSAFVMTQQAPRQLEGGVDLFSVPPNTPTRPRLLMTRLNHY